MRRSTRRSRGSSTGSTSTRARSAAPARAPSCHLPERGFFFPPTLFTGVSQSHRIAQEEIFGPVLSVLTFRTPEEAIEKANNTPYGLSAGGGTEKGSRILWMGERVKAGGGWADTVKRVPPPTPLGGGKG